jgi:hypothetical protein
VRTAEEDAASTITESESVQDNLDLDDGEDDSGSSSEEGEDDGENMEAIDEAAENEDQQDGN